MDKPTITKEIARQHARAILLYLREVAKQKKISMVDIANATGLSQPNVSRALAVNDNNYMPELDTIIRIAHAINLKVFFEDTEDNPTTDHGKAFEEAMNRIGRRPDKLPKN